MKNSEKGVMKVLKCFTVQDDGEIRAIEINSYEDLAEDQVYLLVDHDKKHIFIWKGRNAPVRRKFISARTAQSMRNELGLMYKVISVEQGNETNTFGSLMKGLDAPKSSGATTVTTSQDASTSPQESRVAQGPQLVPKVVPTTAKTMQMSASAGNVEPAQALTSESRDAAQVSQTSPKVAPMASPRSLPETIKSQKTQVSPPSVPSSSSYTNKHQVAGGETTHASVTDSWTSSPQVTSHATPSASSSTQSLPSSVVSSRSSVTTEVQLQTTSGVSPELVKKVTELLEKMDKVPGMVREIVIIGDTIFSVLTEHLKLFNKEVVKLEPMEGLPDGLFPAPEYYTRLYVENGKVLFIELFKEAPTDERSEFIDEMKRSLRDLTRLGL